MHHCPLQMHSNMFEYRIICSPLHWRYVHQPNIWVFTKPTLSETSQRDHSERHTSYFSTSKVQEFLSRSVNQFPSGNKFTLARLLIWGMHSQRTRSETTKIGHSETPLKERTLESNTQRRQPYIRIFKFCSRKFWLTLVWCQSCVWCLCWKDKVVRKQHSSISSRIQSGKKLTKRNQQIKGPENTTENITENKTGNYQYKYRYKYKARKK